MKDLFENNCDVVSDLLPLYADGCCSARTARLIQTHLSACKSCNKKYAGIKKSLKNTHITDIPNSDPDFLGIVIKLRRRRTVKNTILSLTVLAALTSTLLLAVTHG